MMWELEQQMHRLAQRVEALEQQNAELRAQLAADAAPRTEARRFDRRNLLRLGGVAAAAGAGTALLRPAAAGAATGNMQFGANNDATTDTTGLTSSNGTDTLHVDNTGTGEVIHAHLTNAASTKAAVHVVDDGLGGAIFAEVTNQSDAGSSAIFGGGLKNGGVIGATAGIGPGVAGVAGANTGPGVVGAVFEPTGQSICMEAGNLGLGLCLYSHIENAQSISRAIWGKTIGKGSAIVGSISNNTASSAAATVGATTGTGPGIDGISSGGVGGRFKGKTAQVQLVPSTTASSHPTSGSAGQLFVDKSKRLWYCRGGTSWKQLA
jgi:hypothetical protein